MKGVKSFRIDDLLTNNYNSSSTTKNNNNNNNNEREITSQDHLKCDISEETKRSFCIEESSNSSSSGESTCSSSKSKDMRGLQKEIPFMGHRETNIRSDFRGTGTGTNPPIPIPAYHPNLPAASHPYGYEGATKAYPYNFLPYALESYKLNPHSHGMQPQSRNADHHAPQPPFPILSSIPSGFSITRGDAYHAMMAHFAAKQAALGNGFIEKRSFLQERLHYPLYSLNRSLYSSSCKRKGGQIRFNNSQTAQLEKAFLQQKYLNAHDRKKLAHSLGLSDRQVKTWFQNRRAKLRKCKGGGETEESGSGSPQDLRTVRLMQYENGRYERPPGIKTD